MVKVRLFVAVITATALFEAAHPLHKYIFNASFFFLPYPEPSVKIFVTATSAPAD